MDQRGFIALTWKLIASGMGRSTMSARQRSVRLLSKLRNASTWHHTPSLVKQLADPPGLNSMVSGHARSFAVIPRVTPRSS